MFFRATRLIGFIGLFLAAATFLAATQSPAGDKLPELNVGYIYTTHHSPFIVAMAKGEEFRDFGVYLRPVVDKMKYELMDGDTPLALLNIIVNKSGGLAGILSERDCFKKVILAEKDPKQTAVRDIMTRKVVVVPPERTVEECMALMSDKHIRHLPVVQGDKILGMISMRDVVRYLADDRDLMIKNLEKYIEGSY